MTLAKECESIYLHHRDKQGGSEAGITQHRIQHGEILLFDEADRIKGGFPEKKQIKCRLFQSRILEKEKSKLT